LRAGSFDEKTEDIMAHKIFVNLAVKDLNKTIEFFKQLGFEFNPKFTDENATCMIVNDGAYVMLLVEKFFQGFTKKALADSTKQIEAIMALSADSRQAVDAFADKALKIGGTEANPPQDHGFMYGRSFQDLDGHVWEVFYMDESAAPHN
jgi:predicted lactoylglutathione lyase